MRALVIGLGALAACYSPRLPAGASCTTDQECPLEQRCVIDSCAYGDGTPAPGSDGGPMNGGGLPPDAAGPCSIVPGGSHDEDGDGANDALDPCPPVRESVSRDTDVDGVSDRCDRAGTQADQILWFEDFQCGVPQTGWSSFNVVGDRSAVTLRAGSQGASAALRASDPVPDHAMGAVVMALSKSDELNQYIEVSLAPPSAQRFITCLLDPTIDVLTLTEVLADGTVRTLREADVAVDPDGDQMIRLARDGTTYRCDLIDSLGNTSTISGVAARSDPGDMSLGVSVFQVSIDIDSMLVVAAR